MRKKQRKEKTEKQYKNSCFYGAVLLTFFAMVYMMGSVVKIDIALDPLKFTCSAIMVTVALLNSINFFLGLFGKKIAPWRIMFTITSTTFWLAILTMSAALTYCHYLKP